jgi:hypothetical protein
MLLTVVVTPARPPAARAASPRLAPALT